MQNYIVETYENYREEDRLTTNNARRVEFVTTARILEETIKEKCKVLDCACGTGAYAFFLAERGRTVTAADITPRHIGIVNERLKTADFGMETLVLDAADMSVFEDGTFDVVLNMGPFYHLIDAERREKCLSESLRVLKPDGMIFTAYIPRFYVFQHAAFSDARYLNEKFAEQIIKTGVMRHDDEMCFWTDSYYSSAEEMERLYSDNGVIITDHFAQDGITPLLAEKADGWNEAQFKEWCGYHYSVCREKSTLGASNHVIIAGRKIK